jgi:regulator of RNase E activity RraA
MHPIPGAGIGEMPPPPPPEALQALRGHASSNLSDVMLRTRSTGALRLFSAPSSRLCGPAFTVRLAVGDHLMLQKALDLARPGDVLVVDAHGYLEAAMAGEIMTRYARSLGLGGFVIDGAVRDTDYLLTQDFPVYARGATPVGPTRRGPGELHVVVQVGGMIVAPGDIVCGDQDGLVSVPAQAALTVATQVEALLRKEQAAVKAIEAGNFDRAWVDEALRANGLL